MAQTLMRGNVKHFIVFKRTLKQTLIHLKTSFLFLTNPSASSMAYLVSMTFEYADEDQH